MHRIPGAAALLLCLTALLSGHSQRTGNKSGKVCNRDASVCVAAAVQHSAIQTPLYFEARITCADQILFGWELRDDSGRLLDRDPDGNLAFLIGRTSAAQRTLGVRDFGLAPATAAHGTLTIHPIACEVKGHRHTLPGLSIPVTLDLRTTEVTYAVPADEDAFSEAANESAESDPAHPAPLQAEVQWRTKTVLYTPPALIGGAAAEASALAYPGQGPWHVIGYRRVRDTAHLTVFGSGWAGVWHYLTGLDYLIGRTAEHQPGVRHVVFDRPPDFGQ